MAKSRKLAKLNRAIREVVSTQVLFRIRDPRVRGVTVLDADLAPDGRTAKVYVTVLGDAEAEARALEGLESAKGFFQAKIADRLETRYTPVLTFVADGGVKRSIEISRALQEATGRSLAEPDPPAPEPFDIKAAANAAKLGQTFVAANGNSKATAVIKQVAQRIIGASDEEDGEATDKKSLLGSFDFKSLLSKKEKGKAEAEAQ